MEEITEEEELRQREWSYLKRQHEQTGLREGLEAGREQTLQEGFNAGFSQGVRNGWLIGTQFGISSFLKAFLEDNPSALSSDIADKISQSSLLHEKLFNYQRKEDEVESEQSEERKIQASRETESFLQLLSTANLRPSENIILP
eukprot:TRINITY_DN3940_c0_g1_i1.p1 TRINITY_DN3940_c0_g1~~TRINITY_DN3940_c0_g1_i1.p1  ORF type:complete len:158 (-),score=44.24 TRINITY_DN3940_c0_g1_i1:182-613(-)